MASGTIKTGTETQSGVLGQLAGADVRYYWDKTNHAVYFSWVATGTRPSDGEYTFPFPSGLKIAFACPYFSRDKMLCTFNEQNLVITQWNNSGSAWDYFSATLPTK